MKFGPKTPKRSQRSSHKSTSHKSARGKQSRSARRQWSRFESLEDRCVLAATIVSPAAPDIVLAGGAFAYDGLAHAAAATAFQADGVTPLAGSFTYTYNGLPTAPTAAGTYSVSAKFISGDPAYADAVAAGTITIDPAKPAFSLIDGTYAADGKDHPATCTALGVDGVTPIAGTYSYTYNGAAAAPNAAGTYAVAVHFTSNDPNYASATAAGTIVIQSASSQTVYSQPVGATGQLVKSSWYAPNGLDGDSYVFDNFSVSANAAINEINWRGGYTNFLSGAGQAPVNGFTIKIYASIPGNSQPDIVAPLLAKYDIVGNAGETPAGTFGGTAMFDYKFTLPTAFQATAGTVYWLQIEATQGLTPVYNWPPDWGWAVGTGGDTSHFQAITGGTNGGGTLYFRSPTDLAFSLKTTTAGTQALPAVNLTGGQYVYDGQPHSAAATALAADGVTPVNGTFSYTYNGSATPPTAAGSYAVVASFASNDPNYASATASGEIVINAAEPALSLSGGVAGYNGAAHAAKATVAGLNGATPAGTMSITYNGAAAAPSAAGTYAVVASFTSSDPNYANATASGTLSISPAAPTLNVVGGSFVSDGTAHSASATAVGLDGVTPVAGTFAFTYNGSATAPSAAGTYAVVATFTSNDPNYANASSTGSIVIAPAAPLAAAAPTLNLVTGTFAFNGAAHGATATAVGADGVTPVAGTFAFTYNGSAAAPSAAGTYAVVASFTSSDPKYANATASGTLTISPAAPTLSVIGGSFVHDGQSHAASATAVGVDGTTAVAGTFTFAYNGSAAAPSAAGTYAVVASFTSSDPNYANASASGTLTIGVAAPTVNVVGGSFVYDGQSHAASATAVGADGTTAVAGTFAFTYNGSAAAPTAAGKYVVTASFTSSDPNYANATASGTLTIDQATPAFSSLSSPAIVEETNSVTISGHLAAGAVSPSGESVTITVHGATQTAVVDDNGDFLAVFATHSWEEGSYAVAYAYSGGANFNAAANGASTLTVKPEAGDDHDSHKDPKGDHGKHQEHKEALSKAAATALKDALSHAEDHAAGELAEELAEAQKSLHAKNSAKPDHAVQAKHAALDHLLAKWDD